MRAAFPCQEATWSTSKATATMAANPLENFTNSTKYGSARFIRASYHEIPSVTYRSASTAARVIGPKYPTAGVIPFAF